MSKLIHSDDPLVHDAVDDAVLAACDVLERTFPGGDKGGICSNFQNLLSQTLLHMLKGRSLLDGERGHPLSMPALIVDDSFFGAPLSRGEAFLVTKVHNGSIVALSPGRNCLLPIEEADKAWPSYADAAKTAWEYIENKGLTYEGAQAEMLQVKPVYPNQGLDRGYSLKAT